MQRVVVSPYLIPTVSVAVVKTEEAPDALHIARATADGGEAGETVARPYEEVRLEEEQSKLDVQEAAQEVEFLKQGARSRLANHHLSTLLTPDRTERRVGTRTCVRPFHGKHRFVTQAPTRPSSAARPWAKAAPRARRRSKRR